MTRLVLALLAVLLLVPAGAQAAVTRAEGILPPGQSGFVSTTGVASGTGSPHLTDQTPLFVDFKRKPLMFNQPGDAEEPKPGVRIVRDRFGVPSVNAGNAYDLWWGAGYAVAQDRLFQMELFRRATTGRLAEILGEGYLEDDIIARRDYYTKAERARMLAAVPPALQDRVRAYRDGVNAWIAHVRTSPSDMPGEFAALGVQLQDWTEDDTVAVGIYLARTVPSGSGPELANLRTLRSVGVRAFTRLLPLRVKGQRPSVPPRHGRFPSQPGRTRKQEIDALHRSLRVTKGFELPTEKAESRSRAHVATGMIGHVGGSLMFAVRRKAGGALLFNGPQLGYSIPELFVELELHGAGVNARGVTAAGIPLVAIGHNGNVAWGYTSGLSDEDDLYAEELVGDASSERYRFQGAERTMECRDERFTYRSPPTDLLSFPDVVPGAGERVERICRTVHGPVEVRAGKNAYARRYAIWGRELETIVGLNALMESKSVRDVDAALQQVTWNENIIAADSAGNIGYWHPGLHPLRPLGYDERLPYPGTGEAEWRGLLPRRRTPYVINPKQGWLANWNNVPSDGWTTGDGESNERLSGRYHRVGWLMHLTRLIKKNPTWETADRAIRLSGSVAQQRPLFTSRLKLARRRAKASRAVLDALLRWDGSYHRQDAEKTVDPGVAIWEEFKEQAETAALTPLGGEKAEHLAGGTGSSHAFDISAGEAYALRTLTPHRLRLAAVRTHFELEKRFGTNDISKWRTPRKMYKVSAQGAGSHPDIPFFDRGTWEQVVELSP